MNNSVGADSRQIFIASEELSDNLNIYRKKIEDLYNAMRSISGIWVGSDSLSFIKNVEKYRPRAEELGHIIEGCALFLNEYSKNVDDIRNSIIESSNNLNIRSGRN